MKQLKIVYCFQKKLAMNELIFLLHIFLLIVMTLGCLKLGETALSAFIILMGICSNLFVLKQINLFSLNVTAADAYAICGIFSLNLMQEYFGKEKAKNLIFLNFFVMVIFGILCLVHTHYSPSLFDETNASYTKILSHSPRIIAASLVSYFISQKLDLFLFGNFRRKLFKNFIVLASVFSTALSQLIDTLIFSFLALYGHMNSLTEVILFSLTIKYITIFCMSPVMNLSKKIMRTAC